MDIITVHCLSDISVHISVHLFSLLPYSLTHSLTYSLLLASSLLQSCYSLIQALHALLLHLMLSAHSLLTPPFPPSRHGSWREYPWPCRLCSRCISQYTYGAMAGCIR